MRKPKTFLIVKYFQGGRGTYYANMPWGIVMKKGFWDKQLELWGECTSGGHCYGYTINVVRFKAIPEGTDPKIILTFEKSYLEPVSQKIPLKKVHRKLKRSGII